MIIDVHCHVWPDWLAPRVLARRPAGLDPVGDGTVDGLLRAMDAAGIDRAGCLTVAESAEHVASANAFIGRLDRSRLIPFGTVHTGLSVERNLQILKDNGIRAVKLHPNFQGLSLADPAVVDLLRGLAEERIVVLAHVGEGSDEAASERAAPRHMAALTAQIPDLRLIACHFGGYHRLDEAQAAPVTSYVDTSWPPAVGALGVERLRELVSLYGADRLVFGSDWPMADPAAELRSLRALGLSKAEEEAVLGGTLLSLLEPAAEEGAE
jgi:predicted TIM-barrel fold metal-dependent hydrolase